MWRLADVGEHIASRRVLELRGDPVDDHHVVALVHEEVDRWEPMNPEPPVTRTLTAPARRRAPRRQRASLWRTSQLDG